MAEKLIKGTEVAEILGISKALAYQLLESGEIKSIRFRRTVRCRPSDLEKFLVNHQVGDNAVNSIPSGTPKAEG